MTDELAAVRRDGGAFGLRLERVYDAPPEEVWAAFTEPKSIRRWLFADAILEPCVGGRAEFRWGDDGAVGVVREWDPPRLLEMSWTEQETASIVRVEIAAAGAGALLVLDHSNLAASSAVGLGAGWHAHLVALGDVLARRDAIEDRWEPLYRSLRPAYDRLVQAVLPAKTSTRGGGSFMQTITPYLLYKSCEDALDWLARAFSFEEVLRYTGEQGYVNHAEMKIGDGASLMMGNPGEGYRNPRELGQATVGLYVMVDDVDAHFERAKAAGAEIKEEPVDEEYGHRRYTALDPEGHHWYFAQVIAEKAPEDWGAEVATAR